MKNLIWIWLLVILFLTSCKTKQVISKSEQSSFEKRPNGGIQKQEGTGL